MTTPAVSNAKLDQLAALYSDLKPQSVDIATRLKAVTDAIKVELANAAPGATKVDLHSDQLDAPLRLSAQTTMRIDTKLLKEKDPDTWNRYARESTTWYLRALA